MTAFEAYLRLLQRYALLLLLTFVMGIAGSAYLVFQVLEPVYRTEASALVLQPRSSQLGGLVSRLESQLELAGPLKALSGMGSKGSSLEDLVAILRSRSLSEKVLEQLNLRVLSDVQMILSEAPAGHENELLVEYLQEQVNILPPDARNSTLRVKVELSDPVLAAQIANAYLQALKVYLVDLVNQEQKQQLTYLQTQLTQMENQLKESEQNLLNFQKIHKTVSLDDEVSQMIKNLADLEARELTAKASFQATQAQLSSLEKRSLELVPEHLKIRNELELKEAEFRTLQHSLALARANYQQSLQRLPDQALALARLERQVRLKNQLYLLLQQQTQAAHLEAARTVDVFRILDPAIPPLEPVKPLKGLWLVISGIISIALGVVMASVHDYLSRINKESLNDASNQVSSA